MEQVTIQSVDSAAKLVFSNIEGEYFLATYDAPELRVSRKVWGYTDCERLVELFEFMAAEWRGWDGDREWSSIEGEFSLSGSADRKGHIQLQLKFVQFEGRELGKVETQLNLEAGLMDGIAGEIRRFFLG